MAMTMEEKIKKWIEEVNKEIDKLLESQNTSRASVKEEVKERIEELKRNRDQLETYFEKFRNENKDSLENIEKSIKDIGKELKGLFSQTFSGKKPS